MDRCDTGFSGSRSRSDRITVTSGSFCCLAACPKWCGPVRSADTWRCSSHYLGRGARYLGGMWRGTDIVDSEFLAARIRAGFPIDQRVVKAGGESWKVYIRSAVDSGSSFRVLVECVGSRTLKAELNLSKDRLGPTTHSSRNTLRRLIEWLDSHPTPGTIELL